VQDDPIEESSQPKPKRNTCTCKTIHSPCFGLGYDFACIRSPFAGLSPRGGI
jgi:hypothetical protein